MQNLSLSALFQGDMPDGMHKSTEGCDTNPTYIAAKKAKHLEDSETTPKSCLDAVFKLLETSSQTSSQNLLSESVRLLQSQCRGLGATYAKGWLIMVGASRTSPVPGNGMRRRHACR